MKAWSADKIFTGEEWLQGHSVIIDNDYISDIIPTQFVPSVFPVRHYSKCFIAPAFIDIQIYGASGSLLAVYPSAETLGKMYKYCVAGGARYFLPTVATNTMEVIHACIDAIKNYWKRGGKGVMGLHIEGPWLNSEKRGAHVEALIHSPQPGEVQELLEYGKDVIKMITLAPEVCSKEIINLIHSFGVIVSAGHSNATYKEGIKAFNSGIRVATHLFNAMSPLHHREPGLAGAIMHHPKVMSSIVPDGYHVDFAAIGIAKKVMGERLFIITDAVTEANKGPYPHQLEGEKYISNGILSGSALTMLKGVKKCVEKAGIQLDEALRMASLYPARVLGMDNELGKIKKGYKADFVIMTKNLDIA